MGKGECVLGGNVRMYNHGRGEKGRAITVC